MAAEVYENLNKETCFYGCNQLARFISTTGRISCEDNACKCPERKKAQRALIKHQRASGNITTNTGARYSRDKPKKIKTKENCHWCGDPANYQFKNGKYICSDRQSKCKHFREETKNRISPLKGCKTHAEKVSKAMLRKYGVSNAMYLPKQQKKIRENQVNSIKRYFKLYEGYVEPCFKHSDYKGTGREYTWKCCNCEREFTKIFYGASTPPYCNFCKATNIEKFIAIYLRELGVGFKANDRIQIAPYELDFYLEKYNFAIETHGAYWHSEVMRDDHTHLVKKLNWCNDKGIRLIQIFEDEILDKPDIVKSRIASFLGKSTTTIFARKCKIVEVSPKTKNEFLDMNHIQGSDRSKVNLGLEYEGDLVSVMTFSKPRVSNATKETSWELSRFCSTLYTNVPGAASRLLKHFERNYEWCDIKSFADLRWNAGGVYEKLGFNYIRTNRPDYGYFNHNTGNPTREHKSKYARKNLPRLLGDGFDPTLSETVNMQNNGYRRLWDAGKKLFVKTKNIG